MRMGSLIEIGYCLYLMDTRKAGMSIEQDLLF
jgi:hypothetical protein